MGIRIELGKASIAMMKERATKEILSFTEQQYADKFRKKVSNFGLRFSCLVQAVVLAHDTQSKKDETPNSNPEPCLAASLRRSGLRKGAAGRPGTELHLGHVIPIIIFRREQCVGISLIKLARLLIPAHFRACLV
jgi:hypothetical protein